MSLNICTFTNCITVAVGCKVYNDSLAISLVNDGYYSNNGLCYHIVNGVITTITTCQLVDTSILASNVWIFNIQRGSYSDAKTSNNSDTIINTGSQNVGNALTSQNEIGRLVAVFDTSIVSTLPTSGTVSFYIVSNPVLTNLTFNNIKPNVVFNPTQTLTTADWDSWNGSHDSSGVSESSRTISPSETGKKTFNLSSSQLSDIYNNNAFSYFIISNGDKDAVQPSTDSRPLFSSVKGLGLSGIGDYELILHY